MTLLSKYQLTIPSMVGSGTKLVEVYHQIILYIWNRSDQSIQR